MSVDPYLELVIPEPTDAEVPRFRTLVSGTGNHPGSEVPGTTREPGTGLYADVAGLLDGTLPDPPEPEVLACSDGVGLFYSGQVNHVFGDPESGKSWLCLAAVCETLSERRRAVVVDLDHNGVAATLARLVDLGAPVAALRDLERFRYVEPEDAGHLVDVVRDLVTWRPHVVVVDSVGELLPLFGASSNSPDEFTRVHSLALKPLAHVGAAVVIVDHLAKSSESRSLGATGTAAKKRAVGGTSLRVTVADQFTPGRGGSAHLSIAKDRHGGLRAHRPAGDREPLAGTFRLYGDDHDRRWTVHAPAADGRNPAEQPDPGDLEAVRALDPPATSGNEVQRRMKWNRTRALAAWRALRVVPGSETQGSEPRNHPCEACGEPMTDLGDGATTHPGCGGESW